MVREPGEMGDRGTIDSPVFPVHEAKTRRDSGFQTRHTGRWAGIVWGQVGGGDMICQNRRREDPECEE